jgi:hypothetical protein
MHRSKQQVYCTSNLMSLRKKLSTCLHRQLPNVTRGKPRCTFMCPQHQPIYKSVLSQLTYLLFFKTCQIYHNPLQVLNRSWSHQFECILCKLVQHQNSILRLNAIRCQRFLRLFFLNTVTNNWQQVFNPC